MKKIVLLSALVAGALLVGCKKSDNGNTVIRHTAAEIWDIIGIKYDVRYTFQDTIFFHKDTIILHPDNTVTEYYFNSKFLVRDTLYYSIPSPVLSDTFPYSTYYKRYLNYVKLEFPRITDSSYPSANFHNLLTNGTGVIKKDIELNYDTTTLEIYYSAYAKTVTLKAVN